MARKQAISKSKDTSRRLPDEFRDEAVQMMLDGHNAPPVTVRLGLPNDNMLYR
jgi:transposase